LTAILTTFGSMSIHISSRQFPRPFGLKTCYFTCLILPTIMFVYFTWFFGPSGLVW
jgi:hypothetical protein